MGLFFITGLPRSRTAWFSAFMTASGYPCLHEGINGCVSLSEYKNKIKNISDSNTSLSITGAVEDRKTLVIHRVDAPEKTFINELNSLKGMHVNFNDIDKNIKSIFKYLTGEDIDYKVYNVFKNLNITTMEVMDIEAAKSLLNETNK